MGKWIAPFGVVLGAAVWFLLFVIIGTGLGTAFIAFGCVVAAATVAAAMILTGPVLDAPVSTTGILFGIAAFVILEVVLSVPLWVGVVSGLGVVGLYGIADSALRPGQRPPASEPRQRFTAPAAVHAPNGHDQTRREPVGAR